MKIDKQTIIEALQQEIDKEYRPVIDGYKKAGLQQAVDIINALPATEDEWVSLADTLPPYAINVLTYNGFIRMGFYGKNIFKDSVSLNQIKGVTHWMPLPKLP